MHSEVPANKERRDILLEPVEQRSQCEAEAEIKAALFESSKLPTCGATPCTVDSRGGGAAEHTINDEDVLDLLPASRSEVQTLSGWSEDELNGFLQLHPEVMDDDGVLIIGSAEGEARHDAGRAARTYPMYCEDDGDEYDVPSADQFMVIFCHPDCDGELHFEAVTQFAGCIEDAIRIVMENEQCIADNYLPGSKVRFVHATNCLCTNVSWPHPHHVWSTGIEIPEAEGAVPKPLRVRVGRETGTAEKQAKALAALKNGLPLGASQEVQAEGGEDAGCANGITPPISGSAGGSNDLKTEVKLKRKYTPLHGAEGVRVYSRSGELDYTVYFRFAGGECYSHMCVNAPTPEAARAKAEEQCAVEGIDCEVLYVKDYDEEEVLL